MSPVRLPAFRTVVEDVTLGTAKLEKILAESQSRVASYLDVQYPDSQDVIFLLGGKAVKAGRFTGSVREILTVGEAMEKLRTTKTGTISFFEISKLLMVVILGTFIFEPTHGSLKTKQINFKSLLALFARKRFTGYLELNVNAGLNYLTFFCGQPREGYFAGPAEAGSATDPVKRISEMVENSDDRGEINVYESVGEEDLHESVDHPVPPPVCEVGEDEGSAQFTAEILDLCLVAIYEDLFRIMYQTSIGHASKAVVEERFMDSLSQVVKKRPELFRNVGQREDGSALPAGAVNFERLLKAKNSLPSQHREQEFIKGMGELAYLRLQGMKHVLPPDAFKEGLAELAAKIASSKKAYQGNFTVNKYLYEFTRLLEKIQTEPTGE